MHIELEEKESELQEKIISLMKDENNLLAEYPMGNEVQKLIKEIGDYAHQLHMSLKERGHKPIHHAYMITNRGLQPDDPQFYTHVHPVEDLLGYIKNSHANDDPEDKTIGQKFKFRIYSRRWGHDDIYNITRTEDGWDVGYLMSGPCDKGGHPFLFENFNQDSIVHPNNFDGWLEWLWEQAASNGLTKDQVQTALQELADWVSNLEKNAPSGDVWRGYS